MDDPVSPVFEQNYQDYLEKIKDLHFPSLATRLGGRMEWESLIMTLFNRPYVISPKGILNTKGEQAGYDASIILSKYLLMCPKVPPRKREWVTYREFKDSGPLTVYFRDNVEQFITQKFAGKLDELKQGIKSLNAIQPELDAEYDLAAEITALPKIPMLLLFNDADEGFPASCSVLMHRCSEKYLDAECLAMLGYRLARIL